MVKIDLNGCSGMVSFQKKSRMFVMLLTTNSDIGVVAHECLHLTSSILLNRGINIDSASGEESYAYLLEYLVNKVTKQIKLKQYEKGQH